MNIYKIAQRMFDTYGMEDVLLDSFKRHHQEMLKGNNFWSNNQLDQGESLVIGTVRIGNLLQKIIEKHGLPRRKDYPKTISFVITSKKSKWVDGKGISAFFHESKSTKKLYIFKVVKNVRDIEFDDSFRTTLQHELQHIIFNMYSDYIYKEDRNPKEFDVDEPDYFKAPHEIQAHCGSIARRAFMSWKDTNEYAMRTWTPQRILKQVALWRSDQGFSNIVKIFLLNEIRDFDVTRNNILTSDPDLKKTYLYTSYRNLQEMMNNYANDIESQAKANITEQNH